MFHSPSSSGYYSDQQRFNYYPGAGPWMTPRHGHGGFHGLQGPGLNDYHQPYLVVRGHRSRKNIGGSGSRPVRSELPSRSRQHHHQQQHQAVVMASGGVAAGVGGGGMMSDFYPARLHQHPKR